MISPYSTTRCSHACAGAIIDRDPHRLTVPDPAIHCAPVQDFSVVQCPYCFESVELVLDPETSGAFVQDCDVCCNPWQVEVARGADGLPLVRVERLDE